MKRSFALTFFACTLAYCLSSANFSPTAVAEDLSKIPPAQPKSAGHSDFVLGTPVRYKNLTIFPVESSVPKNEDRFLTLEEGLKAGTVQVYEVGAQPAAEQASAQAAANQPYQPQRQIPNSANGSSILPYGGVDTSADVNHLMIVNTSTKPLYLMPGEIIYGGQQDRTIAVEAIVPPSKTPVKVAVYCVEHGRWSSRGSSETVTALAQLAASPIQTRTYETQGPAPVTAQPAAQQQNAAQHAPAEDAKAREKLAEDAKHGKFVAHAGSLSKAARAAVQEGKGQSEVWDKVGEANEANANRSRSGDFAANYTSPQMLKNLQGYIEAMQSPVASRKQVVGALVAVNGKVEAVDVFQSTPLFTKLWPKLLKSHALDAAAEAKDKDAEKVCSTKDAEEFLSDAMKATIEKKSEGQGGLVVTKRDSAKVMSFSAAMPSALRSANSADGDFGDSVHSSAFKK